MDDASELVFQNEDPRNGGPNSGVAEFSVQVQDTVEKSGTESVCFLLTVRRLKFAEYQDGKDVKRFREDFRSLDRRIRTETAENFTGVIAPRLSHKETSLIDTVPDNNARFMGECAAERVMLQRYVNAVLLHPIIGRSKIVEDFLTLPDFSQYSHYKFSLAKRFNGVVDELRSSNYLDPDATLEKRKETLGPVSGAVSDFHNTFTLQNINKKNLSAVMALVSQSLNSGGHPKDPVTRLLVLSTDAMKQEEYGWHLAYWNGELTLGTYLKHHIAQLDSVKDMINRRRALLHDADKAKSAVEHAKPLKKESVSQPQLWSVERRYNAVTCR
ncbi:hypothetical protein BV898_11284 [Hypsibius exemplaris]|uniref:PX domain-containing protein n=1 Tax=Hypsibius exemplaris TaxID=2072580 RepID=A0A1W0WHG2_HYPEX|nr:hypothetical protein BV898_11284 [Hypsibius exemplaris]